MRSNRKKWLKAGLCGFAFGTGLLLTGCRSGSGFLSKDKGPASPPPMWQVKPSDAANAARKASSDIASAEDGTGNAFSPPGSIQQTSATGQKNQSAGRGQSTGFQSANTGGARPITPPPTAQGSAFNTASQLPLPKVAGVVPIGEAAQPASEIESKINAPGRAVSMPAPISAVQDSTTAADLLPPPPPTPNGAIPVIPPSLPVTGPSPVPAIPPTTDLPLPPPVSGGEEPASNPVPVPPPLPVVNPNPAPNVSGPAVPPLPIGGSQLPPPPGSPTMQGSPLSIPAAPSAVPNR